MGNCLAVGAAHHVAHTAQPIAGARCSLCGEPAPRQRLHSADVEEWVTLNGALAHRRCAVAARLAEAREQRERAAYARAKQTVYPLPSKLLHAHHGDEMHDLEEGREWAHSASFRLPYWPSDSVATLQQHLQEREQEEEEGAAGAATAADAAAAAAAAEADAAGPKPAVAATTGAEPAAAAAAAAVCHESAAALGDEAAEARGGTSPQGVESTVERCSQQFLAPTLSRVYSSSDACGMGSRGRSGACSDATPAAAAAAAGRLFEPAAARGRSASAERHRHLLRRPSPVHSEALLEAKTLRRLSGPHPVFNGEALHADPDGGEGSKQWRAACKQAAAERAAREARRATAAAESNGF